MRLENLLALTHAKLQNKPCVSNFENIIFDINKVNRGDLFIARDIKEVPNALRNGAYGILYEDDIDLSDNEIAWIKSDNLDEALKRLLRFRLVEKEVNVYRCNELVLKLAKQLQLDQNCTIVSGDIEELFKNLWHIENRSTLLFSASLNDERIFANYQNTPRKSSQKITIMEKTLFETSFIYDDNYYERQLLSPFFIPYLEELLNILKTLKINYKIKKFTPLENFEAVFTNKNFEIKEFGTSDKVLIFESNLELISTEIEYLQRNATWANIIYIVPKELDIAVSDNIFVYNTQDDILDILKENRFNFAFIAGAQKSILQNNKPAQSGQLTLEF
jgi:ferrochelatase